MQRLTAYFFDPQTYVNLEVYDDKEYANFDGMTEKEWRRIANEQAFSIITLRPVILCFFFNIK